MSEKPSVPNMNLLKGLDYDVLQQCMHCGMCLPTCPTYEETKRERNSPRGRIALMRAIADNKITTSRDFADEMYYCLGCLACETACPAGVDYAHLFEMARAESERSGVLKNPARDLVRAGSLRWLFRRQWRVRLLARGLWIYQATGLQRLVRALKLTYILPKKIRNLEKKSPTASAQFTPQLVALREKAIQERRFTVGLLSGCVQDVLYSSINKDTADVLRANGCEVITPRAQGCCGSLHGHNGDLETARALARDLIAAFPLAECDAIITNAAGCGSHLKHFDRLLADDPVYREKAVEWSRKVKDIHQWLAEIGFRKPAKSAKSLPQKVTYHEACHLCHGQKITQQPREVLRAIPGLELVELQESTWCCGSAGIYSITQPEMAQKLMDRKKLNIETTQAATVATANPGCLLQIEQGLGSAKTRVCHPITLLAEAYRNE
jgi:glycolate oxidase iron-sulfur subunit